MEEIGRSLSQALRYVAAWRGKRVVIKLGGRALHAANLGTVIEDVVLMQHAGLSPVLVHGGGPEISSMLERLGLEPKFIDGLRVTDRKTMEVVEMVLAGSVNERVVGQLQEKGGHAVGLSGKDGGLLRVRPHPRAEELGFVGEVSQVETSAVETLIEGGFIPVVASLGVDAEGNTYNLNADSAAASLAVALGAEKLLVLTDVRGICRPESGGGDGHDGEEAELISEVNRRSARELMRQGILSRGMIPKVEACLMAIDQGVPRAHILGAALDHGLLVELFTEAGVGTMIRRSTEPPVEASVEDTG